MRSSALRHAGIALSAVILLIGPAARVHAQTETLTGFLNLIWIDPVDGGEPELQIYVSADGIGATRLAGPGVQIDYRDLLQMSGRMVMATGSRRPAAPAGDPQTSDFVVDQLGALRGLPAPAAAGGTFSGPLLSGPQPFITVLCRFGDLTGVSQHDAAYYNAFIAGPGFGSLDHYWRESSYENINLTGSTAAGWFNLPKPRADYLTTNPDGSPTIRFGLMAEDCTAAADASVNFADYVGVNMVFNGQMPAYYGGGWTLTRDGVTKSWRMTWMQNGARYSGVWGHEMGHSFGFPHSSGPYGQTYDSRWDVMSGGFGPYVPAYAGNAGSDTISYHKDLNGWIPQSRLAIVQPGSSVTLSMDRLALPASATGILMAKIPIGGSSVHFYTVEARRRFGYDSNLPGNAIIIHEVRTPRPSHALVADSDDNGNPNDAGAMWIAGETFIDAANGFRVSVLAETATAATVLVTNTGSSHRLTFDTLAGTKGTPGSADGAGTTATFNRPRDLAMDAAGNAYVADSWNHTIRKITPAGVVTIFAGQAGVCQAVDATGTAARFCYPSGIAIDAAGTLFVTDSSTHTIRKITPAGVVTTVAGVFWTAGIADGAGSTAHFTYPSGISLDGNGTLYVSSNHTIRKITAAGVVTTLAGAPGVAGYVDAVGADARFANPNELEVDSGGNVFLADSGNSAIRKISPSGVVTTLAGQPQAGFCADTDGTGTAARFCDPRGLALDAAGSLFVSEWSGQTIRKVTAAGVVTTAAGAHFSSGTTDGLASLARFNGPQGLEFDQTGALYVLDTMNHAIRKTTEVRLTMSAIALRFGATKAGATGALVALTPPQDVVVSASGTATPAWTVTADQPWVQITGVTGTGSGRFTVAVTDPGNLLGGATVAASTLTLSAPNLAIATTLTVWLTIQQTATPAAAPIGSFDTPTQGAVGVQGSIAVTGWAVDDVGISRVEIWRDVAPGETTPPFSAPGHPGHGKIFIANPLFIGGARPDVETAYWNYPRADRAGWGYLLLTWGLWAQGNGTYTLHAFAFDEEGQSATLGSKTIAVSNQLATKPFGGIDTPSYGQTVSGGFWNYGWTLTPGANAADNRACTIANGSAQVGIDSGPLVPVSYGDLRTDIAGAFPGFSNGHNAGGAYYLDTRTLSNGTHQIGWFVVDSCGRADGVGSRFFSVLNGSAPDVGRPLLGPPSESDASNVARPFAAYARGTDERASASLAEAPEARRLEGRNVGGPALQIDSGSIAVRRLNGDWTEGAPNAAGIHIVPLGQSDRLEVQLPAVSSTYAGAQIVNGERRALPLGSSLDVENGIFYWQPAAGFLGSFELEFGVRDVARPFQGRDLGGPERPALRTTPTRIRIVVGPPMRMAIDTPQNGAAVAGPLVIAGWAIDLASADGSGIDTVHVWAYPTSGRTPIFLGVATVGDSRPDVAATYGAQFDRSSYSLTAEPLAPGTYDIVVYPHRASAGAFEGAQVVRVTLP